MQHYLCHTSLVLCITKPTSRSTHTQLSHWIACVTMQQSARELKNIHNHSYECNVWEFLICLKRKATKIKDWAQLTYSQQQSNARTQHYKQVQNTYNDSDLGHIIFPWTALFFKCCQPNWSICISLPLSYLVLVADEIGVIIEWRCWTRHERWGLKRLRDHMLRA